MVGVLTNNNHTYRIVLRLKRSAFYLKGQAVRDDSKLFRCYVFSHQDGMYVYIIPLRRLRKIEVSYLSESLTASLSKAALAMTKGDPQAEAEWDRAWAEFNKDDAS